MRPRRRRESLEEHRVELVADDHPAVGNPLARATHRAVRPRQEALHRQIARTGQSPTREQRTGKRGQCVFMVSSGLRLTGPSFGTLPFAYRGGLSTLGRASCAAEASRRRRARGSTRRRHAHRRAGSGRAESAVGTVRARSSRSARGGLGPTWLVRTTGPGRGRQTSYVVRTRNEREKRP